MPTTCIATPLVYLGAPEETAQMDACAKAGSYLTKQLPMKNGVHHLQDLLGELPLRERDEDPALRSFRLQLLLYFIQQLAEKFLSVLLIVPSERRDQAPHRVQHGKGGHERPLARPHHSEEGVQFVTEGDVL